MAPGWQILGLTVSDLGVIALMIVVFLVALFAPHPQHRGRRDDEARR